MYRRVLEATREETRVGARACEGISHAQRLRADDRLFGGPLLCYVSDDRKLEVHEVVPPDDEEDPEHERRKPHDAVEHANESAEPPEDEARNDLNDAESDIDRGEHDAREDALSGVKPHLDMFLGDEHDEPADPREVCNEPTDFRVKTPVACRGF